MGNYSNGEQGDNVNNIYPLTQDNSPPSFDAFAAIDNSISHFTTGISKLRLNHDKTNKIYGLVQDFVTHHNTFIKTLIASGNKMECSQLLDFSSSLVCAKLAEFNSQYKRKKKCEEYEEYIAPKELAVGVRWELAKTKNHLMSVPRLVQCKYYYISIMETLASLFRNNDFRNMYFNHNKAIKPANNIYSDFSSGTIFKSNELFCSHPNSIQIQIATDDFEICNPLGSKATLHKVCAFYFTINNIPQKYRSKTQNIYPVLLCNSDDLKTPFTDINDVLRPISRDLMLLEKEGIPIDSNASLRGTLVNLSFDNLGGNTCLSMVEGFRSLAPLCRVCECPRSEFTKLSVEDETKIRNRTKYEENLQAIDKSDSVDLMETRGIKRYCVLNDLKYFHTFENFSVDIMHDLNEGCIPFLLKKLFGFCVDSKLISKTQLVEKFRSHEYGALNRSSRPSTIYLHKDNLNQTASQLKCLFLHIPFVLFKEQNHAKLKEIWECVESLLIITRIAYSLEISEDDLIILRENIQIHLDGIQKCFNANLIPKHHNLTHYPRIISLMGSLVPMSMMRYESKHKELKKIVSSTNNFKNITKTISMMHQQIKIASGYGYKDELTHGKAIPVPLSIIENDETLFSDKQFDKQIEISEIQWLKLNEWIYRSELFVVNNGVLSKIDKLYINGADVFFFVLEFEVVSFYRCLNSAKIKSKEPLTRNVIKFSDLQNQRVYEKVVLNNEFYLIIDSLETERYLKLSLRNLII